MNILDKTFVSLILTISRLLSIYVYLKVAGSIPALGLSFLRFITLFSAQHSKQPKVPNFRFFLGFLLPSVCRVEQWIVMAKVF